MLAIMILILATLYFKGFWILNKFKDYYSSGKYRQIYLEGEMNSFLIEQKQKKDSDERKQRISKKYKDKLLDFDRGLTYKIVDIRISNVYKKYFLINQLNNKLLDHTHVFLNQLVNQDYNKYLALAIKILIKRSAK